MGKVDQMRALREARFKEREQRLAKPAVRPSDTSARPTRPVQATPVAPSVPAPVVASPAPAVSDMTQLAASVPSTLDSPAQHPAAVTAGLGNVRPVTAGKPIGSYRDEELQQVIRTVLDRDGDLDVPGVMEAAMTELGFVRRGKVIKERLLAALLAVQEDPDL